MTVASRETALAPSTRIAFAFSRATAVPQLTLSKLVGRELRLSLVRTLGEAAARDLHDRAWERHRRAVGTSSVPERAAVRGRPAQSPNGTTATSTIGAPPIVPTVVAWPFARSMRTSLDCAGTASVSVAHATPS